MSGIEFLGAVAAGAQLVGYIFQVGDLILELRAHIKNCPARIQSYSDRLTSLSEFIQDIRDNDQLCGQLNPNLVYCILKEVEKLRSILQKKFSTATRRSPTRYLKIPQEKKAEKQIKDIFVTLDGYKMDLMLRMQALSLEDGTENPNELASVATSDTLIRHSGTQVVIRTNTSSSFATTIAEPSTPEFEPSARMHTTHEPEGSHNPMEPGTSQVPPDQKPVNHTDAEDRPSRTEFNDIEVTGNSFSAIGTSTDKGNYSYIKCRVKDSYVSVVGPNDLNAITKMLTAGVKLPIPKNFNSA